jgi:two-component system LytT family sensor kinase
MDSDKRKTRISSFWGLHVLGWLVAAGLAAIYGYQGSWTEYPQLLVFFAPYMAGFLICIPLRYFYRKIRLHERPLKFAVLTALAASFVGANLWLGTDSLVSLFIASSPEPRMPFAQLYAFYMVNGGSLLVGWTSLYFALKARREWEQQKQRTKKANALAQMAQLQMLRYQLNPHFLFNAMNSIRALIDEDETKARDLITELSEFLRYSLDSKDYADVPLQREIEAIQHYFAIQKKRYEDKIEVIYDIEPQAAEFPVLSFLIHPLVENAVKYGMRTSPLPLVVHLKAHIRDGALVVEVGNTGRWVEPGDPAERTTAGTGTGLDNVRRRLENAFPNRHHFEVVEKEGCVRLQLEIRSPKRT